MADGWISIHRKIRDCEIWDYDEPFTRRDAWIDLLLLANHRDKETIFNGKRVTIKRGQYLTSIRKLAQEWQWGNEKTLKYLRLLEECNMIVRDANSSRTLITIVNYEVYQNEEIDKRNANQNSSRTDIGTESEQKSSTNNKDNNDNKIQKEKIKKEKVIEQFRRLKEGYNFPDRIISSLEEWFVYKEGRKDAYKDIGMKKLLTEVKNHLEKYGEDYVIAVIDKSIIRTWQGITWDAVKPSEKSNMPDYKTKPKEQWDSYTWNRAIKDGFVTKEEYKEWSRDHVIV